MSRKYYRFYGGLLSSQNKWLNKMAQQGYRLIRTDKMLYEFEECNPGQVQYYVDFIGHMSKEHAEDYFKFLEDMGYRVFYKNINLNYSMGKLKFRPWAEKGGRWATNETTYNRELLIVEKGNDGKPFELHTSYEDVKKYYKNVSNTWLCLAILFAFVGFLNSSLVFWVFAGVFFLPVVIYIAMLFKLRRESNIREL